MDDRSDEEVEPVGVGHFDGGGQVGRARVQEAAGGVGNAGHLVITANAREILFLEFNLIFFPDSILIPSGERASTSGGMWKSKQT